MKKFNKVKYDMDYRKKNKSQFNVDINKEEKEEIDELLKKDGITKTEFLRNAIKRYKNESTTIKIYIYSDTVVFTKDSENNDGSTAETFYIDKDKNGNDCISISILDIINNILNINNYNIVFVNKHTEKYITKKTEN